MSRSLLALLVTGAAVFTVFLAWPASESSGNLERREAIFWAAQHLLKVQNDDGGWPVRPGEATSRGTRAVVGRALLWAWNVTGSPEHLEGSLKAADGLMAALREDPRSALALDGVFLLEVGRVTGREEYTRAALGVHYARRHARGWSDGASAAASFHAAAGCGLGESARDRNLAVWRGLDDVELARLVGEHRFAEEMGRALVRGLEFDPDAPAGTLVAAKAAEVLEGLPGNPMSGRVNEWLGRLRAAQVIPGVVTGDGEGRDVYAQDAAHVLIAFVSSRDSEMWALAHEGSLYLVDCQLRFTDGSWEPVLALPDGVAEGAASGASPAITADVLLALSRVHRRRLEALPSVV